MSLHLELQCVGKVASSCSSITSSRRSFFPPVVKETRFLGYKMWQDVRRCHRLHMSRSGSNHWATSCLQQTWGCVHRYRKTTACRILHKLYCSVMVLISQSNGSPKHVCSLNSTIQRFITALIRVLLELRVTIDMIMFHIAYQIIGYILHVFFIVVCSVTRLYMAYKIYQVSILNYLFIFGCHFVLPG